MKSSSFIIILDKKFIYFNNFNLNKLIDCYFTRLDISIEMYCSSIASSVCIYIYIIHAIEYIASSIYIYIYILDAIDRCRNK